MRSTLLSDTVKVYRSISSIRTEKHASEGSNRTQESSLLPSLCVMNIRR